MRHFEGIRDLTRNRQDLVGRQGALCDPIRERRAFDELENQRGYPTRVLEAVDRADVRMIERGQELRVALEPRQPIGARAGP